MTKPGVSYMTDNGVTIIGYTDFPARMGAQASSMYATNMLNLLSHVGGKEGAAAFWDNWKTAFAKGEDGDIIWVERFDRRGTEPFKPFEPFEFFKNRNFP